MTPVVQYMQFANQDYQIPPHQIYGLVYGASKTAVALNDTIFTPAASPNECKFFMDIPFRLKTPIPTPPPEEFKVEGKIPQFLFAPCGPSDGLMYNDVTRQWARYDGAAVTEEEILSHVLERVPGYSELVIYSPTANTC